MRRNRKYRSAAIRFGPALKAFLLCLLIGGSGVGYVWQKDQISQLGKQIAKREAYCKSLAYQNENLRKALGTMRSPQSLGERIRELGLGLARPQPTQVWYLPEPTDSPGQPAEQQLATPRTERKEPRG